MFPRHCKLPENHSFFLFGARQTGKSTLVSSFLAQTRTWSLNLFDNEQYYRYLPEPSLFRREAEAKIRAGEVEAILVDEVQRIPEILNEVQLLIDNYKTRFVLTGSSARKLKRGGGNLLGGRALERRLFPLTHVELGSAFDLEMALRFGTLPPIVNVSDPALKRDFLSAYTTTYLREEIQAEGLVRNMPGFTRFLEIAAFQSGSLTDFSGIGREVRLPARTVQSYFEILEETLVGVKLEPYGKSPRKRLLRTPKFYLFDTGVVNAVSRTLTAPMTPERRGRLLEHLVVLEAHRTLSYLQCEGSLYFWQTNAGAEVDLLIERAGELIAAIEVKNSPRVHLSDLSGLRSFKEAHPETSCYVVCGGGNRHELGPFTVLSWQDYSALLNELLG